MNPNQPKSDAALKRSFHELMRARFRVEDEQRDKNINCPVGCADRDTCNLICRGGNSTEFPRS